MLDYGYIWLRILSTTQMSVNRTITSVCGSQEARNGIERKRKFERRNALAPNSYESFEIREFARQFSRREDFVDNGANDTSIELDSDSECDYFFNRLCITLYGAPSA